MILMLSIHPSRVPDLLTPDHMRLDPPIPANTYHDGFGNFCHVIRAPAGRLTKSLASVRPSGYEARSAILLYLRPGSADLNLIESAQGAKADVSYPKLIRGRDMQAKLAWRLWARRHNPRLDL